jgi:hypothetical protein
MAFPLTQKRTCRRSTSLGQRAVGPGSATSIPLLCATALHCGTNLSSHSGRRPQPILHLLMFHNPSLLHNHPPTRKNHEVRDPPNAKPGSQARIGLGIYFKHHSLPGHIHRSSRHLRRSHPAGPTPLRPEINKHRNRRTLHDLIKPALIHSQRLAHRRQFRMARPATSGARQVLTWHPVVSSTNSTSTNYRHKDKPPIHAIRCPARWLSRRRIPLGYGVTQGPMDGSK